MTRSLALDIGNRFIKSYDGVNQPWTLASVHTDVINRNIPPCDTNSVDIEYHAGNSQLSGKRWIVGTSARQARKYTNTVSLPNKTEVALKLLLAAIKPKQGYGKEEIVIDPLYTSLPNPDQDEPLLSKAVIGTHEFTRNRVPIKLYLNRVVTHAEGLGSYNYAVRQGAIRLGEINGVLDLGGGTAIASLYNGDGQQIPEARAVFRKGGSYSLASDLAADPEMVSAARGTPQMDMVLDAIASGTYHYGTTNYSFRHLFEQYRDIWLENLVDEVIARWDSWLDRISKIVVVGGAAPLAQSWIDDPRNFWLVLCPEPQFANVLGMLGVETKVALLRSAG